MGQIVGGNTNLEFYKQLETINNELDDINTTLASHTSSISSLNSSYGTNENGFYLRLPDGTQICWLNIVVTDQAINTVYAGGIYIGGRTWTFPKPFISAPVASCGAFKHGTGASWGSLAGAPSESGVTLRGYDVVSRDAGPNCIIQAMAIGRWKS